jgi:putative transferase (TIGR04331 family)
MQARHLVTTADERTWPTGQPLLFLGGWCQRWERRNQWQTLDATWAEPYGLGQRSKDADHAYVRDLEMSLFPELCDLLGRWHGVSSDQRYWRIILGHWFRRYVEVIFNRTRTLQSCIAQYSIDSTTVLENSAYSLATNDSYAAIWASNDDRWNHELYVRLMKLMPEFNIRFESVVDDRSDRGFSWQYKEQRGLRTRMVSVFRSAADRAISLLQAEDDVVIVNSYLPRKQELKLQVLLGQCPQLLPSNVRPIRMEPDTERRRELCQQIAGAEKGDVEQMVRTQLFELLPVCYLEAFSLIKKQCARISWPSKPRAVFTSNNFDTDEIFKSWVADKVLQGSKYITGQHGNNYGTHRHHVYPSIEEITADRFVTWGWEDGLSQHRPAFLLKTTGRKTNHPTDPAGELLLIEFGLPHRLNTWDVFAEFDDYFEDQKRFVSGLTEPPCRQLRVRLSRTYEQMGWGELERWREFDSGLQLNDGTENIDGLIAKSRLVVHSYDSTGILETLSQNIPTVAFWQNGLEHVRDSARPWYQLLIDVGIVHLSAASAAQHVSNVWDDVAGWWELAAVKNARLAFCNQYARTVPHPLQELRNILKFY